MPQAHEEELTFAAGAAVKCHRTGKERDDAAIYLMRLENRFREDASTVDLRQLLKSASEVSNRRAFFC